MYNVFQYDLAKAKAERLSLDRIKEKQKSTSSRVLKDQLIQNYKERVARNVALITLDNTQSSFGQTKSFLGKRYIRFKPKDSTERVKEVADGNKWLDTIPSPKFQFTLRNRNRWKELHSDMKFKPRDRLQRLKETWEYQKDQLFNTWTFERDTMMPSTMGKTYNKTIETIANELSVDDANIVQIAKEATFKSHKRSLSYN